MDAMKKTFLRLTTLLYIFISFFTFIPAVYADEKTDESKEASPAGFTYEVVHPENRIGKTNYLNLRMQPGQKQTAVINLINTGDEEVTVKVSLNGAKTNGNGVIEYGPSKLKNDASLKYDIVDIVKVPETVLLRPKETVPLEVAISMPDASFDGYISGGIQLQRVKSEQEKKDMAKSGMVINEFAYLTGVILSETDTLVKPELKLNKVYPGLSNYRNTIFVNFSNIQAEYLEEMTVDVQIMKKGQDKVLIDTKQTKMRMAPNSMIDFPVSMNGEKMVPGDYRAKILVTGDNQTWEWEEAFKITDEDADKYNTQDVTLAQERGVDWKLIVMIVGGILLLLIIIYLIVRTVNKRKKLAEKAARKKKKKLSK